MTLEELKRIAASVGERQGWDFSRVQDDRDPIPWDYADVLHRYLRPSHHALDIGTGGGEWFLALSSYFGTGVGIDADPSMIQVARENTPPSLKDRISFEVMRAQALRFLDAAFDVVLNRHAPIFAKEIVRVLCPGGYFISQQVGVRNTRNILAAFGWGPESYGDDWGQDMSTLAEQFQQQGCTIIARAEYDVHYYFLGVESLVFWLKAIPLPEGFDVEKHWRQVDRIIQEYHTPRGIETNEHRELLVVQKLQ